MNDQPAAAFDMQTIARFAAAYPDRHAPLRHQLGKHPLLARDALAQLAERLPTASIEWNLADLPLGILPEDTPGNGLSPADTIRSIDSNRSWIVMKNVEQDAAYGALLDAALAPLVPAVMAATGPMAHREAFIFVTAPGGITPLHIDPEHNILLQIEGSKTMNVFPAGDPDIVPPQQSEAFHAGGHRNLIWDDGFHAKRTAVPLGPGDAVLMPVKAPHFVENGPSVSVSLSITWRSERSVAEGELHSLNRLMRARGWPLVTVTARPERQKVARIGYRVMQRLAR